MRILLGIVIGIVLTKGVIYLLDNYTIVEKKAQATETSSKANKPKTKKAKVFGCENTAFEFEALSRNDKVSKT